LVAADLADVAVDQGITEFTLSRLAGFCRPVVFLAVTVTRPESVPSRPQNFGDIVMRNSAFSCLMVVLVCFAVSDSAFAQGQGNRRGRGGQGGFGRTGVLQLLGNVQVQRELKLADDQIAKIKEISDANRPQRGGQGANNQRPTDEELAARRTKAEEAGNQAVALLNAGQKNRFQQVRIWSAGTGALTNDDEVAKQLNLTDDQKGALKTIGEESAKKRGEITQGMRGANDETRKKIADELTALRISTENECLAVLTDDQKAQFEKLRGPKFELDRTAFGSGGRGGRRGGNNNN
jgi:Spy/CpxP family protein refolding chaperone